MKRFQAPPGYDLPKDLPRVLMRKMTTVSQWVKATRGDCLPKDVRVLDPDKRVLLSP